MKKIHTINIVFVTFVLFLSCQSNGFLMGKAKVTMLTEETYSAKTEDAQIDVYYTNRPNKNYIELAQITCEDTEDDWCLKQIKIKAREIGADGIIILGKAASAGVGVPVGNMYFVSDEAYGMKAIAIKYTE
ncbi:MAG: hypothetical protein IJ158_12605 [Treponema sp.]|nr:hypothetical protein [Treponema sp.]MBR1402636.1 hypothetical protein [Treponema sp.]